MEISMSWLEPSMIFKKNKLLKVTFLEWPLFVDQPPPPQETDFALLWQLVNVFFFAFIQIQSQ